MGYNDPHDRGASDGGFLGLAAPPQGCQCRRAHYRPHSSRGDGESSRSVGQGVLEMRIDYGPGYRIYYVHRGAQVVILVCGGDKRTQQQDIKKALRLAETL